MVGGLLKLLIRLNNGNKVSAKFRQNGTYLSPRHGRASEPAGERGRVAPSVRGRVLPSFSHSRLDAPGPMADFALGDQGEQPLVVLRRRQSSRPPLRPQLHRVLEAQAARVHASIAGGLHHEQPDHVVGQQVDSPLCLVHLWRLGSSGRPCRLRS
jgi:hypothetical protein